MQERSQPRHRRADPTRSPRGLSVLGLAGPALLLAGLLTSPVGAVPQVETTYGGQNVFLLPEYNAMAGTGASVYRGGMSTLINPALLVAESGTRVDAALAVDQQHEDRFQPLFDSFDSFVTDVAIASNRHHFTDTGFAFARSVLAGDRSLALGVSLADRYPYAYDFEEELRNPDLSPGPDRDRVLENRRRQVTGTLRTLSFGAGVGLTRAISLGVGLHYAFGERDEVNRVRAYVDDRESYREEERFDLSGYHATVGGRVVLDPRVAVGVAWEMPLEVDGDIERSSTDNDGVETITMDKGRIRYPNIVRGGLRILPRNDPRTVFTLELEWAEWKMLTDTRLGDDINPELRDVWDVRAGVEHRFYNDMALRFGFRRYNSYQERDVGTSVFAAGLGVPIIGGRLTGSVEISKTTAILEHQFPYPEDYLGSQFQVDPEARVEDTRFRFGIGYSGRF